MLLMTKMKILIFVILAIPLALILLAQELQHDAIAINIEVPVRVFKGNLFVDNLSISDFELYEDGKSQKIEAVYLIKKTNITREEIGGKTEEIKKKFAPDISRYFVLVFILSEYLPKLSDTIDYFIDQVIQPDDILNIVTPMKAYSMEPGTTERISTDKIKEEVVGTLRKDITTGNLEYTNLIKEIENAVVARNTRRYESALMRLQNLRFIDQNRLIDFAEQIKTKEGQKYIFLFYQQETIPMASPGSDSRNFPEAGERGQIAPSAPFFSEIHVGFDVELIKQAFSDSSISSHFLYITKNLRDRIDVRNMDSSSDMHFIEISGDIYKAFKKVVAATGGTTETSSDISYAFKKAVAKSESYYLIYYVPKNYRADGKFKMIEVKVKGKKYKVTHRAGYIAD